MDFVSSSYGFTGRSSLFWKSKVGDDQHRKRGMAKNQLCGSAEKGSLKKGVMLTSKEDRVD
jgi:hypothetical protein